MQFLLIYSLLKIYSVRISALALIRAESVQIWNITSRTQFISCWYETYANQISGAESLHMFDYMKFILDENSAMFQHSQLTVP